MEVPVARTQSVETGTITAWQKKADKIKELHEISLSSFGSLKLAPNIGSGDL